MAIVRRKKKNGQFAFQVRVKDPDGNWYPTSTFEKIEVAQSEELRLEALKRKGARAFTKDAKTVTFAEYWEVWSIENRREVSEGWKISQNQMYRDYVMPVLGQYRMIEVGAPEIGKVLNRSKDLGLSPQTQKHVYTLMNTMFRDAVEYYEMLGVSPVKPRFHRPKVSGTQRPFLTPDQSWALLRVAREHSYLGPAVWLQILAGMRCEAMQGLAWSSVMWDLDQILLCRAWKEKVGKLEDYPKGKDWKYVPMPPALKEYLWTLWQRSDKDLTKFVCTNRTGKMLPYGTYLRALPKLCEKAQVPTMTTHELRHSSTELYVQAGASGEDIRRLLNHVSLTSTAKYMHRTNERLSAIAGQIGKPMLTVIEGDKEKVSQKSFPNGKKEAVRQS